MLASPAYIKSWHGRTVKDMVSLISGLMPYDNPGGLDRQTYVDITAYWLRANQFPPGKDDLPRDDAALSRFVIAERKIQ